MQNILNLLTLELQDRQKSGQTHVTLSDQNVKYLQSVQGDNLDPSETKTSKFFDGQVHEKITAENDKQREQMKTEGAFPENEKIEIPAGDKNFQYNWLRDRVLGCPICNKHVKPGKKVVFGVGSPDADIFFCGEAPGADEEVVGEPFVGRAGQLLTKIISAMGLQRSEVYIGNIMNWRPEIDSEFGNRPPTQAEMEFCLPYLKAQIEIVQPKVIVALGSTAVSGLLGHDSSRRMRDVRGKWLSFQNIPLMITFHPSYVLRNNTNTTKRTVWEDMLQVMERTGIPISDKQQKFFL